MTDPFHAELLSVIPRVRSQALSLAARNPRHTIDDLMQDAIERALRFRHTYRPGTNLGAWLYVIVRSVAYAHARRDWRWQEAVPSEDGTDWGWGDPPAPADANETVYLKQVLAAIENLSPHHKEALVMFTIDGVDHEEMAQRLDVPLGTVKSRVSRARAALHEVLDRPGNTP